MNNQMEKPQPCPPIPINHNGFTSHPTLTQIMPVLLILTLTTNQIILCLLSFPTWAQILLITLHLFLFTIIAYFWYHTTKIIPTDNIQLNYQRTLNTTGGHIEPTKTPTSFYCHICTTPTSKNSFHCRRCNRCVGLFDHHCRWLNNCIGAKNYLQFYALILTTFLFSLLALTLSIYIGMSLHSKLRILAFFNLFLSAGTSIWLGYLVGLHSFLIINKKTTLELILQNRRKNKIHPSKSDTDTISRQRPQFPIELIENKPIGEDSETSNQSLIKSRFFQLNKLPALYSTQQESKPNPTSSFQKQTIDKLGKFIKFYPK